MKKWISNATLASKMGSLNKSVYEKQISNMVSRGTINESQADYMQSKIDTLKEGIKMRR